jgi:hypothetical protein
MGQGGRWPQAAVRQPSDPKRTFQVSEDFHLAVHSNVGLRFNTDALLKRGLTIFCDGLA